MSMKMIQSAENIKSKLIADIYKKRREVLIRFIANRINDVAVAEDMSQDVFAIVGDAKHDLQRNHRWIYIFRGA